MKGSIDEISMRRAAIVTGVSLLVMAAGTVFATDIVLGRLVVQGDAAATTSNIRASETLFRAGIFSWLIVLICDVLAAWGLYIFLKPVNRSLSLLMVWFRLVYAAMLGAALFNLLHILLIISPDHLLAAPGTGQLQAQVMLRLSAFSDTWGIGLVVFGFHILVLGYLAFKAGYIPKFFGVVMMIAFFGYLTTNSADLLIPGHENLKAIVEWVFLAPMVIGELGLALWLLIRGGKSSPGDPI